MRHKTAIGLVSIIIFTFFSAPFVTTGQDTVKKGVGPGQGMRNSGLAFDFLAKGQGYFLTAESRRLETMMRQFLQEKGVTDGKVNRELFIAFDDHCVFPRFGGPLFSPDGKSLAAGSYDQSIKLRDAATGKEIATLTGHNHSVYSLAYSPDGRTLASGSYDQTLKLWDVAAGKELVTLKGHLGPVYSVLFSPDGKTLASGSWDSKAPKGAGLGSIKLWDMGTGKEIATLEGHVGRVFVVAFSPDGKTLASGSQDQTIKLWDVATGKEMSSLKGHVGSVYSLSYSPDGKTLASASGDETIKLWDSASGEEKATLKGHAKYVISLAFSPDGRTLASGSGDQKIKVWEVASGKERFTLAGHKDAVWSVAYSPNGKALVSESLDKTIKLWDVWTGKPIEGFGATQADGKK